jgi:hypothetical protein
LNGLPVGFIPPKNLLKTVSSMKRRTTSICAIETHQPPPKFLRHTDEKQTALTGINYWQDCWMVKSIDSSSLEADNLLLNNSTSTGREEVEKWRRWEDERQNER